MNTNSWYGIDGARFVSHGEWSDSEIEFDGVYLNYWDVIDMIEYEAREVLGHEPTESELDEYMSNNPESVYCALLDCSWALAGCN